MTTADFNDKDKKPVKCDAQLHCTAAPQLAKAVAEELKDEDKDIMELVKKYIEGQNSATE
jgi:hypothetical protein